jgi:hypothetical protein
MLEALLLSPGGLLGAVVGLGVAALLDWAFPSMGDDVAVLYAGLAGAGFFLGLVLGDRSTTSEK